MTAVLDHGYLTLVESWGSDERIVEAARMSTNKGFLGWGDEEKPGDEKLLKYLYEHKHATPFEMGGMVIEVQAPIFVFREWHRHRTQCLSGDTHIALVSPRGTTYKRTIKQIFDLKFGGVVDGAPDKHRNGVSKRGAPVFREARRKDPWRVRILPSCQNRMLRVLNEATGEFEISPMADVWESGIKEIFALETGGRMIRASAEHPFFTKRGWVKLKDLELGDQLARVGKIAVSARPYPPALRRGIGVWTTMMRTRIIGDGAVCYLCDKSFTVDDLELDHVISVTDDLSKALDVNNLKPACHDCHRQKTNKEQPNREGKSKRGVCWERLIRLPVSVGCEMTYDLQVNGAHHNYLANDFVVHNSYNEMSARYTPLPDLNYVPTVERLLRNAQSGSKQAGTLKDSFILDEERAVDYQNALKKSYRQAEDLYKQSLMYGVPKELARIHLPVGRYSRMRASANLRNWLSFLTLRMAPDAQWEIQQYANKVAELVATAFPRTYDLFAKGK